jgi:hypothetical protein
VTKRLLLFLLMVSILSRGICSEACAMPMDDDVLWGIVEEQPVVKCIDVFSDISLRLVQKWFVVARTEGCRDADGKKKRSGHPTGGAKDCTVIKAVEGNGDRGGRAAADGMCLIRGTGTTAVGISALTRGGDDGGGGYAHILLQLLLISIWSHGSIGDAMISLPILRARSFQGNGLFLFPAEHGGYVGGAI